MRLLFLLPLLLLTAALITGCDRAFTPDIESETPPELHVFVRNAGGTAVSGATVGLYRSAENRDAGTNAFFTGTSDSEGRLVATATDIGTPGVVYVHATSGNAVGSGATPYLLLTDGITYYYLTVN
jgi:hypothetical protein